MPEVTIDGRTLEVERGTNLIDAAHEVGVQIPHYCYHPRLSVVGQCRMCLVKVDGMRGLQPGCTTQVMKDGMMVHVDDAEVREAQQGMMEFLLINHPLDCPICDQAGECGLQDYSFKHGQAFSRFRYEEKRTYPGKERIPLGPSVVLNMNRCIQCTRCIRFTEEVTGTGELGFFQRGSRAEIGVFPDRVLDNDLSTCVVDLCPVGALTSTRFRFAERVWNLDKQPSICVGCDAGCNITIEHRRGSIRRHKPRFNTAVNDYWMCDHGRGTFERYAQERRLRVPKLRKAGELQTTSWKEVTGALAGSLMAQHGEAALAFLATGYLTTEEAFLMAQIGSRIRSEARFVLSEEGPTRSIPTPAGGVTGSECSPNRRGVELAGMKSSDPPFTLDQLLEGDAASRCGLLLVADGDPGSLLHRSEVLAKLRQAKRLVVMGWAETPLTKLADLILPIETHPEKTGTYVNTKGRLQPFEAAFPAPAGIRSGVSVLSDLLGTLDRRWKNLTPEQVFERMSRSVAGFYGRSFAELPAEGVSLEMPADPAGATP
ncbi:MAG: 2Fe-2S iron-sulfur cluster-binding protein [Acidobacteriota bacterium]|nr:2Fe-2S iron-sulfur cluster-binding protein [Acidobacteriota bacterium]